MIGLPKANHTDDTAGELCTCFFAEDFSSDEQSVKVFAVLVTTGKIDRKNFKLHCALTENELHQCM